MIDLTLTQPSTLGSSLTTGNALITSHPPTTSTLQSSTLTLATQLPQGASQAHTFTVTNTNDIGNGSLRQAILNANADSAKNPTAVDVINFNLGTGAHTITLTSATLDITALSLC